jgi:hypothetical protein
MVFAAIQFIRSYFFINAPYLDEARYEAGTERIPYQGRILMAYLIKAVDRIALWNRIAFHLRGPLHEPSVLAIAFVGLLSMGVISIVIYRWYRLLSPACLFPWLPFALLLWMMYSTYLARFQEAIYFPYDLLSVAFFTVALFLCFRERYLSLAIVFSIACFNRETVIILLLPIGINAWLSWRNTKGRFPLREVSLFFVLVTVWIGVLAHYYYLFANNPNDLHNHFRENLRFLATPQTWSQILSGAGFLLPVPFLWFQSMPSERMRLYSSLILVWTAFMFLFGVLPESRIFGELIGFLSVYCAIQFETYVRSLAHSPDTSSTA